MTNISYLSNSEGNQKLLADNFEKAYCKILNSNIEANICQLIWLFTNMICEDLRFAEIIMNSDIMGLILKFLNTRSFETENTQNFYTLIKISSNFFFHLLNRKNKWPNDIMHRINKISEIISTYIFFSDENIVTNSIWTIMFISDLEDPDELFLSNLLLNNNFLYCLLGLDFEEYKEILFPSLKILGNILSTTDNDLVDSILDLGVLDFINVTLSREKNKLILRTTIWIIANICGGSHLHVKKIVESEIFGKLLILSEDYDYSTKKEAIFTIMNICSLNKNFSLSCELVKKGIYKFFVRILESNSQSEVYDMILTSIENILSSAVPVKNIIGSNSLCKRFEIEGGVSALEKLQFNSNDKVYKKSEKILETYFQTQVTSLRDYKFSEKENEKDKEFYSQGILSNNSTIMSKIENKIENSLTNITIQNSNPFLSFTSSFNKNTNHTPDLTFCLNTNKRMSFHELFKNEIPNKDFSAGFDKSFNYFSGNNNTNNILEK